MSKDKERTLVLGGGGIRNCLGIWRISWID